MCASERRVEGIRTLNLGANDSIASHGQDLVTASARLGMASCVAMSVKIGSMPFQRLLMQHQLQLCTFLL